MGSFGDDPHYDSHYYDSHFALDFRYGHNDVFDQEKYWEKLISAKTLCCTVILKSFIYQGSQ
jgi:hypothetical protein